MVARSASRTSRRLILDAQVQRGPAPTPTGAVEPHKRRQLSTVIGFWQVPAVSVPPEPAGPDGGWDSSSWIGIDGWLASNDLLQAGIDQRVDAQGNAHYAAWYEWYVPPPAPGTLPAGTPVDGLGYPLAWVGPNGRAQYIYETAIAGDPPGNGFSVSAGDQIYCSVQYINNNTAGHIMIGNATTGAQFSITLASFCKEQRNTVNGRTR